LLQKNQFADAISLFDQKAGDPDLKDAVKLLEQEKADMKAVAGVRDAAIEALRGQAGKTVKLRMGKRVETGKVQDNPGRKGVTLNMGGPVMTFPPQRICAEDIDRYSPKAVKAEDMRLRGIMFLYAEDLAIAKDYFAKAQAAGVAKELLQIYLDRIAVLEMGAAEATAAKAWKRAESLFDQKRLKEAEPLYLAFQEKHSATQVYAKNTETLKKRLTAIAEVDKPKISFVAEESMKPEAIGYSTSGLNGIRFPKQVTDDPTGPFRNQVMYFDQRTTKKSVVYRVVSPRPMAELRWKGAAMLRMGIEVLDANGKILGKGGPYNGGNKWAEYRVKFQPSREFTLRFSNYVSRWYMIGEVELFPAGVTIIPPKPQGALGPPRGENVGAVQPGGAEVAKPGPVAGPVAAGVPIPPDKLLPMLNTSATGTEWRVEGTTIAGKAGSIDDNTGKILMKEPFKARAFDYGFRMMAKQYQIIIVLVDGERYYYSRGHWSNKGGFILTPDGAALGVPIKTGLGNSSGKGTRSSPAASGAQTTDVRNIRGMRLRITVFLLNREWRRDLRAGNSRPLLCSPPASLLRRSGTVLYSRQTSGNFPDAVCFRPAQVEPHGISVRPRLQKVHSARYVKDPNSPDWRP